MSNEDGDEDEVVREEKPHLMMVVYIQEQRPDLRILDSWSDSIRTLGMFGMDACPECNSDPRALEAYTTCLSCRLVGSGPVEIPEHVLNFGIDIPTPIDYESEEEVNENDADDTDEEYVEGPAPGGAYSLPEFLDEEEEDEEV